MSLSEFKDPPKFFRGTELWMLNDRLEDDELRRQIYQMSEQGFYSFIARTYIGLKSDYPGPAFMQRMRTIVDAAREYGMKVFLQAGYMPEAVLDLPEEFALTNIHTYAADDPAQAGEWLCTHGEICYRAVNSKTFLDMLSPAAMRFYMKQSYEDMWQAFADEFGQTILSVWVDEPSYSQHHLPWSSLLPERYREKWQAELKDKVYLLFVDGPDCATVRYQYWQTVQELMKEAYFTEVRDWCRRHNLLFSGHLMAEDTLRAQISRACATMPFYKYFDMPGIDYLTVEMNWRHNAIPAKHDHNARQYGLINTPLQCSSAAHQAGQEHVLCEMFGVSTQNLLFRDQKHLFDHFASLGINHKCSHGVFYSLRGRGKRAYPPHINDYQPYWPEYGRLNDYFARAGWFISQGRPVRDVLVIHPLDSAYCEYHGPSVLPAANTALERRDQAFYALLQNLLACQYDFELGDEDTIREWGQIDPDGAFRIGQMAYRTLVLPELLTIQSTTLALIEQFATSGGRTYLLGRTPEMIDGRPDPTASERLRQLPGVLFATDQAELLQQLGQEAGSYQFEAFGDATAIQINHRSSETEHFFFIFNRDCREGRAGSLSLAGRHLAWCWEGRDGEQRRLPAVYDAGADRTRIKIQIEEGGSLMLSLEKSQALPAGQVESPAPVQTVMSGTGPWQVRRRDANALLLEFCRYRKSEADPWSALYPILAVQEKLTDDAYVGPLSLQFAFNSSIPLAGLKLALEDPEACTVILDGQRVGSQPDGYYLAKAFSCLRLPAMVEAGPHLVEIRRSFKPLAKARSHITSLFEDLPGVELEAMILVGDFAVLGRTEPTKTNCVRMNRSFVLGPESGRCETELVSAGYPFYAGTLVLEQTFRLAQELDGKQPVSLELDGMRACYARILVNGQEAGLVAWAPYAVDVGGLLHPGDNILTIELTNTLRNLLGPYHRPKGEFGECWPGYGRPNLPWLGAVSDLDGKIIIDWAEQREPDTAGWTEAYLQVPLGINGFRLISPG
jgi:hypothetical protein